MTDKSCKPRGQIDGFKRSMNASLCSNVLVYYEPMNIIESGIMTNKSHKPRNQIDGLE